MGYATEGTGQAALAAAGGPPATIQPGQGGYITEGTLLALVAALAGSGGGGATPTLAEVLAAGSMALDESATFGHASAPGRYTSIDGDGLSYAGESGGGLLQVVGEGGTENAVVTIRRKSGELALVSDIKVNPVNQPTNGSHLTFDSNQMVWSSNPRPMSAAEAQAGTETKAKIISPKILADEITRRLTDYETRIAAAEAAIQALQSAGA